jgi:phosphoribosyl 1,2-cyclic phosphodiesterase
MRFASLGSGSRGNALVIEHAGTRLLIDCGFSLKETRARLARLGLDGEQLDGIVLTHEHGDHCGGVWTAARAWTLPVWLTPGTYQQCRNGSGEVSGVQLINSHEPFAVGDLQITPYPVPHDAREPCQFVFSDGDVRVGLLTDAGSVTAHIRAVLSGCDALMLECNYDRDMLRNGPYSAALKSRVGGPYGHLDNADAAALLSELDTSRLQHILAMHLSETNNTPEAVRGVLREALGGHGPIGVAGQESGSDWHEVRRWSG